MCFFCCSVLLLLDFVLFRIVKISSGNFVECTGKWTAGVRLGIRGKDVVPAKRKDYDGKFPS